MNCSRFRFLIQQRFDVELAPQDERVVTAHLESCESCAKFHHQVQQVIMAAEEVPLPDDYAPNPPEALARSIMEGLPQPKANPFEFFTKLFAKKEKELPTTIDRNASKFPHVSRGAQGGGDVDSPAQMSKPTGKQREEDHSGTSNRLKALAKGPIENREAQSTTRSLGEKLGFAAPAGGSLTDDQPLTLAESIRRKISEKPPEAEDEESMAPPAPPQPAAVDDSWGSPASSGSRAPANMAAPPNIPGMGGQPAQISAQGDPNQQTVLGSWGKPSPIENSNSWGGQPTTGAPGQSRDDWNFDTSQGGGGQPAGAAQARGSSIDPFAAPGQASSNPNMQAPSADSWGGWNDTAPKGAGGEGDSDWGPPPAGGAWDEPAQAGGANSWGGGAPANKPQQQLTSAQAQAQFGSSVMETGMIKLGELGLPSMPGAPGSAPGAPGAPGMPAMPGAQAAGAAGAGPGGPGAPGTAPDTNAPWGAAPQPGAGAGAADPWGSSSTDSWGGAPSQNAWGSSPENPIPAGANAQWGGAPVGQPVAPSQPTGDWGEPASDSWGSAPGGQGNWGQPAGAPAGSWDQPAADANQPAWGESTDWSQSQTPQMSAPQAMPEAQPQAGSSSQAAALGRGRQAWSLEAEQVETGTWRAFAPSGEALSSGPAARPAEAAPGANQQSFAPQQDEASRWDVPIQDRIKKGGTSSNPQVAPNPTASPSPFAQPAFGQAQAAAAPIPAPQPPMPKPPEPLLPSDSPAPTKSGWNFPVYEAPDQLTNIPPEPKISGAWDNPVSQPSPPAAPVGLGGWGEPPAPPSPVQPETKVSGAWDMPTTPSFSQPAPPQPVAPAAPAPMPGQPGGSVPVDSIMDRLGNVLNNNEAGGAAQAASSQWDVSIQERQQQAAAAAAAQAPQPPSSPWGQTPEPAAPNAVPGNNGGWGSPAQLPSMGQPGSGPLPGPAAPGGQGAPSVAGASGAPGASPWDAPATPMAPPTNPFALPQQTAAQAPAASGWDTPIGQNPAPGGWDSPMGQTPAAGGWDSPMGQPPAPGGWDNPIGQAPAAGGWDSPPNPAANPMANPMGSPIGAPAASPAGPAPAAGGGWDSPPNPIANPIGNPMGSPMVNAAAPSAVPQPAVAAAAVGGQAAGAPGAQGGGLFQNLDDNAIDRLFSENLGVNDAGATGSGAAPAQTVQQAPTPAFTAPRWNPGENGGGAPGQPSFNAPAQPFGAPSAPAADAGGPKISAITPRGAAAAPEPQMPGVDRRNQTPFGMPAAPQTMAPPQPMASPFAQPQPEPAPVAAAAPAAPAAAKNGLFDLDDSAMDELFAKNLGVNEQAIPSNQPNQQPAPQQQAPAPVFQSPPVMAQQPQAPVPPANPFSRPAPQVGAPMPNPFAPLTAPPQQPAQAAPQQQPGQPGQPAWGQPPVPPTQPQAPTQSMQQPPQQGGLFSIDDSMIDKIFADNAAPQPPQPVATPQFNVNEAVKEIADVAQNVPPPKIAGVGRLDPRTDTSADSGSGRIASIGKFLLDQKDLEKIGKLTGSDLSETKMRILTMEAAQELQTLLQHIGTQETVIGSVIVGHDGLLIANTMPPDIDAESIGVWALGLYMSTEMVIKKMGQDRVHQIVSRTPKGYVVIADFGGGLLVTVSDGTDTDSLIPLMRSITQLVAQ